MTDVISDQEADEILESRPHPRVTQDQINAKVKDSKFFYDDQLTICVVTMRNGFKMVGKSAPASPDNYNKELGDKFAYEDALKQAWHLEGYLLCEQLHPDG